MSNNQNKPTAPHTVESVCPPEHRAFFRHPVSLAPMVDKTDRDWRWLMRRITQKTLLYTEMITAPAIIRGNRERILGFDESEKPLVFQIGWDEETALAEACRIVEAFGYDEINLNCGCPSEAVQRHQFGASLMSRPRHTARIYKAMAASVPLPVTVKCRIGVLSRKDGWELTGYSDLKRFITELSDAGCRKFTVHARIAILDGLSPRENRSVPPLRPELVYRLKDDFPELFIEINGGCREASDVHAALKRADAVMMGRIALDQPWLFSQADRLWFGSRQPVPDRLDIIRSYIPYALKRMEEGASRGLLLQPLMNLFAGEKGARAWNRSVSMAQQAPPEEFREKLNLLSVGLIGQN